MRQKQSHKDKTTTRTEKFVERLLDFVRADRSTPEFSPLAVVHSLFTGRQRLTKEHDILPDISAYQAQGICCYYKILVEPSRDAAFAARIGVVAGPIEYQFQEKNRIGMFDSIQDPQRGSLSPYKNFCEYKNSDQRPELATKKETLDLARSCVPDKPVTFLIRETFGDSFGHNENALELGFAIPCLSEGNVELVGPATALKGIVQGTGLSRSCVHGEDDDNNSPIDGS